MGESIARRSYNEVNRAAAATVAFFCLADYDQNPFVNGNDFDSYVADFDAGDPRADIDHKGFVIGDDFDLFAERFVEGC